MKDLAETIQKWGELRKQETSETVEKILQEAQKLLKERIDEGEFEDELWVHYGSSKENFVVEVIFEGTSVKKAYIPFSQIKKVSAILKSVKEEFKSFPQLEVRKSPFAHQSSIYDIEYNIIVQLK